MIKKEEEEKRNITIRTFSSQEVLFYRHVHLNNLAVGGRKNLEKLGKTWKAAIGRLTAYQ